MPLRGHLLAARDLHIEINFLKKIVCGYNFSAEFLNKLCIKNAWKKLEKIQLFFQKLKLFSKYDSILETSFGHGLSSHNNGFWKFWVYRHRFLYFQNKVGISAFQAKFATSSHFIENWAHVMRNDQTIIENV